MITPDDALVAVARRLGFGPTEQEEYQADKPIGLVQTVMAMPWNSGKNKIVRLVHKALRIYSRSVVGMRTESENRMITPSVFHYLNAQASV